MEAVEVWFRSELPIGTILSRLSMAALLGGVLGLERELRRRPAGLRTHMLVSLASATFTVLTFELVALLREEGTGAFVSTDPIRVIQAIVAGVGFLGAGCIIQGGGRIQGLTTGAGVWLVGAVGLACGVGLFAVATVTAVLGFVIVTLLGALERHWTADGDPSA